MPKDIICYLFGLSPMPFWVFAVVSTLGLGCMSMSFGYGPAGDEQDMIKVIPTIIARTRIWPIS